MHANQSRAKIRCRASSKSTASIDKAIATSCNGISDADDELEGNGSQADTDNGTKRLI